MARMTDRARGSARSHHTDAAPAVAQIIDQHGQLQELLGQIEEAIDLGVLNGLLDRLSRLLEDHFALEEAADGVVGSICRANCRAPDMG